jgi:hypothetical protein
MSARKPPDWTRMGTLAGYAKYLREQSGALMVMVIRRDDSVMSIDEQLLGKDVIPLVSEHIGGLVEDVAKAREEKRPARLQMEELEEMRNALLRAG